MDISFYSLQNNSSIITYLNNIGKNVWVEYLYGRIINKYYNNVFISLYETLGYIANKILRLKLFQILVICEVMVLILLEKFL